MRARLSQFHNVLPAPTVAVVLALSLVAAASPAQGRERSGKQVVDGVCAACHISGAPGAANLDASLVKAAPKVGDKVAWSKRASQGLTSLTEHALKGIRNMPAHGGSAGTSDTEIVRAIVHMVNQSGGKWIEPLEGASAVVLRSSEQIVRMQCSKCHEPGADGAPRIGDRPAWIPRLNKGMEALVASAVHGHGPMPARGGMPDLSDQEIRGAIAYMFNYGVPMPRPVASPPSGSSDPFHKLVADTDVYLGLMPAHKLRAASGQNKALGEMHGGLPRTDDAYHLNISLADSKTKASITDAMVKARVSDSFGAETRALELMIENNAVSYGNYFRMRSGSTYSITAQIQRPGQAELIESKFEFKVP